MKKTIAVILILAMAAVAALSGCAQSTVQGNQTESGAAQDGIPANAAAQDILAEDNRISVVCTIFPQYDWVHQILGDRAAEMDLTILTDGGVDLHSFQPSIEDIVTISTCDLFIYVGGESDAWVEDALAEATNPDMTVINLMEALGTGIKTEDIVEGMEDDEHAHEGEETHEESHEGEEAHEDEEEHHEEEEHVREEEAYDEHVWLSPKNAGILCTEISDALCALDAGNSEEYTVNLNGYLAELAALDFQYGEAVSAAPVKTLLFGDRFPFRYLVDDYGLAYYAAFPGCSAETEASFETIVFLSEKVNELNLRNIMVTESADQSIAKTIIGNAGDETRQILVLNALQSVTSQDVENGVTYLSLMEDNLAVLQAALSE